MKRLLAIVFVAWVSLAANAYYDFEVDGICYDILSTEDLTCAVTRNPSKEYSGNITIPEKVDYAGKTYSVTEIGWTAFFCSSLKNITIPNSVIAIRDRAFYWCQELTEITIPSSVIEIEYLAFCGCKSLSRINVDTDNEYYSSEQGVLFNKDRTRIIRFPPAYSITKYNVPSSVTSIGWDAFGYCRFLKEVTIPNSVTEIEHMAFKDCYSLTEVTLPNSITEIGDSIFGGCASLTKITIPNSVVAIGDCALVDCVSLTKITLPDSIVYIGQSAFAGCHSLTEITIPNSVRFIGWYAFAYCHSLTGITIPNGVTSIGPNVFEWCTSLTEITIPSSVTWVNEFAFVGCTSLSGINVDTNNQYYSSEQGVLFDKEKTILIKYPSASSIIQYDIPSSVTSIEYDAFDNCKFLTEITIPSSVKKINISYMSFSSCESLSRINVDTGNEYYSSEQGVLFNKEKTELIRFPQAHSNTQYNIPNSVTSIEYGAFRDCNSLKFIILLANIPPTISSYGAFDNKHYSNTILIVPKEAIAAYKAAERWKEFKNIYAYGSKVSTPTFAYNKRWLTIRCETEGATIHYIINGKEAEYTKPIEITEPCTVYAYATVPYLINSDTVSYNIDIKDIEFYYNGLSYKILSLEDYTCEVIRSLDTEYQGNITIPQTVEGYGKSWNVVAIADEAFMGCHELTSINIPNCVTSIGLDAFRDCTSLTGITIPNSVTHIGIGAFEDCKSLISITISNSVTSIGDDTFYGCESLTEITIPKGVAKIGDRAFRDCTSLTGITIPSSVTHIGLGAFEDCNSLTSITIPNNVTSIEDDTFYGCESLTEITIPKGVAKIGGNAFCDCTSLRQIMIPSNVTNIGSKAFSGCSSLKNIISLANTPPMIDSNTFDKGHYDSATLIVPNGAITVYRTANYWKDIKQVQDFLICDGLSYSILSYYTCEVAKSHDTEYQGDIIIPQIIEYCGKSWDVVAIADEAFMECNEVTSITISNSVTSIGLDAFRDCTSLTSITIPNSVTSIGLGAFEDCNSLTLITIPNSVTSIEDDTFHGCTSLTGIIIPNSVTSIGSSAFSGCTSLTEITIPSSVTKIGGYVFSGCTSLSGISVDTDNNYYSSEQGILFDKEKTVIICFPPAYSITQYSIPDCVTSVGNSAFGYCTSLVEITIPSNVTNIGYKAFSGCNSLKEITSLANTPPTLYSNTFDKGHYSNATLIVPNGAITLYRTANYWKDFNNIKDDESSEVFKVSAPTFAYNEPLLTISCETENVTIHYIIDGEEAEYTEPIEITEPCTVYAYATKPYFNNSDTVSYTVEIKKMEFSSNGLSYNILSFDDYTCEVIKSHDAEYQGNIVIPYTVEYNNKSWNVVAIADEAFKDCHKVTSIIIPNSITAVGKGSLETGNRNMLLYCTSQTLPLMPKDFGNIIIDGVANFIRLVDSPSDGTLPTHDFSCPEPFTARKISYEHSYTQHTGIGFSEGWETIALPFDVQTVYHVTAQEAIAPFKAGDTQKKFWLRELTDAGFVEAEAIKAYTPYIISMPNNEEYMPQYNMPGKVSFRAVNALVAPEKSSAVSQGDKMFTPAMHGVDAADNVYAINSYHATDNYREGSCFIANLRNVRPFEAYIMSEQPLPARAFTLSELNGNENTGIENVAAPSTDIPACYNLAGQKVGTGYKGIVIRNGKKTLVK